MGDVHRRRALGTGPAARLPTGLRLAVTLDPGCRTSSAARFGGALRSRRVELADLEDEIEAMFDRGWTDGLPVVPPTEARVLRMLDGTTPRPTRSSRSCRPTSSSAPSRRSRSTR